MYRSYPPPPPPPLAPALLTRPQDVLARRSSINDAVSSNRKDLEEAEAIEQGRRKAFDDHVKQLRDEVEKSREAREKELKGKGRVRRRR